MVKRRLIMGLASCVFALGLLTPSVVQADETAQGTLVLTNWFQPNEVEYENGKYYNPYADTPWTESLDPKEIGELDHLFQKKNAEGVYETVKLEENLPVGEYKLSPSYVVGAKTLEPKEFEITKDKETVIDLVYSYNLVQCKFALTAQDPSDLNSVNYEVYAYNKDGSVGDKILRGSTNDKLITLNVDPGNYIMSITGKGYYRFVADGENPVLEDEIAVESLLNPDGSEIPTADVADTSTTNVATGKGPATGGNPQTPPTSKQFRVNPAILGASLVGGFAGAIIYLRKTK